MLLGESILQIKGIGEKTLKAFEKVHIQTADDLIHYYPRTYEKFESVCDLEHSTTGERNAVIGTIITIPKVVRYSGKSMVVFSAASNNQVMEVKYFNMPYLAKTLKKGSTYIFRGYLNYSSNKWSMSQPKIYKQEEYSLIEDTIGPIYSLTKELSNHKIQHSVQYVLDHVNSEEDYLYQDELKECLMSDIKTAYRHIHFPSDNNSLNMARRRLVFEEFITFIHAIKSEQAGNKKIQSDYKMIEVSQTKRLEESLPYELTGAQKRAIEDIFGDMQSEFLMNRLIQGDVGSGKTIVAIMALLMCAANGYQGAMMAPTEVLATQHFELISKLTTQYKLPISASLLTGKMSAKGKKEALVNIENGTSNVIIGTHALFQEGVKFNKLALVITDEQHRFGVRQRESFSQKGSKPHILVMSATPIPRTLAMILYGDLDISVIDELPKNRIPIKNCVVDSGYRNKVYDLIRTEVDNGRQAYVICPSIEDEDGDGTLKDVISYSKELQQVLGEKIIVKTLHGKMKSDQKNTIMQEFKDHQGDVLVATTVIEVGIDVPNATVILIENAERFGLSTLHQLRGRVGRGTNQSYCVLLSDSKSDATLKRLKILNETNDGFKIAGEDMRLRGPGELTGVRQSGELQFTIGDVMSDSDIMMEASSIYDKLKERLENRKSNYIDFRTI